mmetsp:Transcript_18101/g.41466  ORF Transcript_18101/g.41466 Transcript_18101/m.41466 type:complete len:323 (-) Transcript_18101:1070-2038(-)|eukprot:CAMPEP_0119379718 /NCGR_PEP_ID=MMETSP1334-20130426/53863_1 /TAXON_ID=127549 /ORGANISM="Calcidiscus leptoporus, Strain RCC1130" /LENGTH=322 /DNA_ID=CAMNT_0007399317 /DNA_START=74 /DNA_END=1042 /DNA_ORIENTATION=-
MSSIQAGAQRAYAQARKAEENLKAKAKAQADRQAGQAARGIPGTGQRGNQKETKVVVATRVRKRQRQKEAEEAEGLTAESVEFVRDDDGNAQPLAKARFMVIKFLQEREGHAEQSLEQVHQATKIDLSAAANSSLLAALQENPKVEPLRAAGQGLRLRYLPPYGIRNSAALSYVLQRLTDGLRSESSRVSTELGIRRSLLLKETYATVGADIDVLLRDGKCQMLVRNDDKEQVLFGPPTGAAACKSVRQLWHEHRVPKADDLQAILVARKVRTADEMEVRKQRKAAAARRAEELKRQPKQRRSMAPRKVTNTHMQQPPQAGS